MKISQPYINQEAQPGMLITLFWYRNVIFWDQAKKFFKNPNFSLRKHLFVNLFLGSNTSYIFQFATAYFNSIKNRLFIYIYFWKYNDLTLWWIIFHPKIKIQQFWSKYNFFPNMYNIQAQILLISSYSISYFIPVLPGFLFHP